MWVIIRYVIHYISLSLLKRSGLKQNIEYCSRTTTRTLIFTKYLAFCSIRQYFCRMSFSIRWACKYPIWHFFGHLGALSAQKGVSGKSESPYVFIFAFWGISLKFWDLKCSVTIKYQNRSILWNRIQTMLFHMNQLSLLFQKDKLSF